MILRNNNRKIIKDLSTRYEKENKVRNRILVFTIAVSFIIILLIFSMLHARYDANKLGNIRFEGEISMLKLLAPAEEEKKTIKNLSYVDDTATEWDLGLASIDGIEKDKCIFITEDDFNDQYRLAFTNIEGDYPRGAKDIMVSEKRLSELGINEPKLGMNISVDINGQTDFVLSGYYTCYNDFEYPKIFLSREFYEKTSDDNKSEYMIIYDSLDSAKYDVKEMISKAIGIKNNDRRLLGEGNYYEYMNNQDNSYIIYIIMVIMILICVYFLVNSSLVVTLNKDMKDHALLKILGATNAQLLNILLRQAIKYSLIGLAFGTVIGVILVLLLVPFLAASIYIPSTGPYPIFRAFQPLYLIISILIVFFISIFSSLTSFRKIYGLSALDSKRKAKNADMRRNTPILPQLGIWSKLAVGRWIKARSNYLSIAAPLIINILIILCFMTWTKGIYDHQQTDLRNEPDFTVIAFNLTDGEGYTLINSELENWLTNTRGVIKSTVVYGEYLELDSNDEVWQPLHKSYGNKSSDYGVNAQNLEYICAALTIDDLQIKELENYLSDSGIELDMDEFKKGRGIICLNGGALKEEYKADSIDVTGDNIKISYGEEGNTTAKYTFLGYLKSSAKGFPKLGKMLRSHGMPLICISEKGLSKLNREKQIQEINLYVDKLHEPRIKKNINKLIDNENMRISIEREDPPGVRSSYIEVQATSDTRAVDNKLIYGMNIVVWGVTFSLIILTLIQYCSVLVTNMIFRNKELEIFHSLGMSDNQTAKLLRIEGLVFGISIAFFLLTVGSGIIWLFCWAAKQYRSYFTFKFLWIEMGIACVILICLAIFLPSIIYKIRQRKFRVSGL